jgi:uncharacterized membrane protein YuzA (DUF378 family)
MSGIWAVLIALLGVYKVDHHHAGIGYALIGAAGVFALLAIADEIRDLRKARKP